MNCHPDNCHHRLIRRKRRLRAELLESRRLLTTSAGLFDGAYRPTSGQIDDSVTIHAGQTATIDLLANDGPWLPLARWATTVDDQAQQREVQSVGVASNGSIELASDGRTLVYTPDDGFTGIDQFIYIGVFQEQTYEGTVTIHVVDAVAAVPDWFRVERDSEEVVLDVIDNDGWNVDGNFRWPYLAKRPFGQPALADDPNLKIASFGEPSQGGVVTIAENGTQLLYTPAEGFVGLESLTYTVESDEGWTATTTIDVRVTSAGDFDTRTWEEWWKHQAILASLETQHAFGQPAVTDDYFHYFHLADDHRIDWVMARDINLDLVAAGSGFADDSRVFADASYEVISSTNVQLSQVGQGDLVTTDGEFIYVVTLGQNGDGTRLSILDARQPDALTLLSETEVQGHPLELLLLGDSLVLISQDSDQVNVATVDVSDREQPQMTGHSTIPGQFEQSRLVDGVVQIYTSIRSSDYRTEIGQVCAAGLADAEKCFFETRTQLIDRILSDDSLWQAAAIETVDRDGNVVAESQLAPHVDLVTGGSFLAVGLFDTSGDITGNVLGSGQNATIFVSSDSVFIFNRVSKSFDWTAQPVIDVWMGWLPANSNETSVTQFEFDAQVASLTWAASGSFDGDLLNSFSVGYHDGLLQLAVGTDGHNEVVLLGRDGEALSIVGRTEPLAHGERIYAARFVEDTAYVVTFRQIDPLFVIDLSDPTNPTVTGELKTPGFSQYLHPIDDRLLIGVGRDADAWGTTTGLQVSLFGIGEDGDPEVLDKYLAGSVASPLAQSVFGLTDHRAFQYYSSHQILALPVAPSHAWWSYGASTDSSVLLLRVDPQGGLELAGEIEFADSLVTRTFRIGDVLYSLSDTEIQAHDLNDPSRQLARHTLRTPDDNSLIDPIPTPLPIDPIPIDPAPIDPAPIDPAPIDPAPIDPAPIDPATGPSQPAEVETMVRIEPHVVDAEGQPVESIEQGQTVWLEITTADARRFRQLGVFSAYVDVDFGRADLELAGETEFSDAFWVQRRDPADRGWSSIGATQGLSSQVDPARPWMMRVPIRIHTTGEIQIALSPTSRQGLETLLYGLDYEIPSSAIDYGVATLQVTSSKMSALDVTRDGAVTAADVVNVINRLIEKPEGKLSIADVSRYDVNADGEVTTGDALVLINYLGSEQQQPQAMTGEADDDDEAVDAIQQGPKLLF